MVHFHFFCAAAAAIAVVIVVVVVVTAVLFACAYCHRSFAKRKFTCRQVKWYNNVVDNCVQLHSKYTVRQYVQDVLTLHTHSLAVRAHSTRLVHIISQCRAMAFCSVLFDVGVVETNVQKNKKKNYETEPKIRHK